MALINTEEAAKRLARVILSDIELYRRERPQTGDSLAAQIEEGRKLFGSRVTPAMIPWFDAVLADRQSAHEKTPVTTEAHSTPVRTSASPRVGTPATTRVGPRASPRVGTPANTPASASVDTPVGTHVGRITAATVRPIVTARAERIASAPAPSRAGTPAHAAIGTPAQPIAAVHSPEADGPIPRHGIDAPADRLLISPVESAASFASGAVDAPPSAPLARVPPPTSFAETAGQVEMPVPVLTSRISIPRLLALVAVVVAAFVFLGRFVR